MGVLHSMTLSDDDPRRLMIVTELDAYIESVANIPSALATIARLKAQHLMN